MIMDRITIVNGNAGDDTVIKNGRAFNFPVDALLKDPEVWAVQWNGYNGEVEYMADSGRDNALIDNLSDFTAVLAEFDRLAAIEDKPPPAPTLVELQTEAAGLIDQAAGLARQYFVSMGAGTMDEYRRAFDVAIAYREAGYSGEVPAAVAANMRYKSLTATDAADDIIAEGEQLNRVLDRIRDQRLDGKLAVKQTQTVDEPLLVAQIFVAQLALIRP